MLAEHTKTTKGHGLFRALLIVFLGKQENLYHPADHQTDHQKSQDMQRTHAGMNRLVMSQRTMVWNNVMRNMVPHGGADDPRPAGAPAGCQRWT
jgi:hypothetical protein